MSSTRNRAAAVRVATLEETLRYGGGGLRQRGLRPPIAGAAGIAVDPSTPALVGTGATFSSLTTASFTPPVGSLLVVCTMMPNPAADSSITDSLGTHLTYTRLVRAGGSGSDSEIWTADGNGNAMTVTCNFGANSQPALGVIVLTGTKPSATVGGATVAGQITAALPGATLPGTKSGSFCLMVISNQSGGNTPTIPAGQTDTFNGHTFFSFLNGNGGWVQALTGTSPGGSVTINDTAPSCSGQICAAELFAADAAPPALYLNQAVQRAAMR